MTRSTQTFGSTTVVNTDNNQKCFLSSKSAYYNDFWRFLKISEDWSNDAEKSALITGINDILKHNQIENSYIQF